MWNILFSHLPLLRGNPSIPDKLTSDAPFKLISASSAHLPVTFSIVSGPATLTGDTLKLTGQPGTVTVRAFQAGNTHYKAATPVERSFTVQAVLAVEEDDSELIKLYPNPATSIIILELPRLSRFQGLQLINAQGKEVRMSQKQLGGQLYIETASLPAGIYILRAYYDRKELKRRIVIR